MLLEIARGMSYLHSRAIIHRDLKSDNVLLAEPTAFGNRLKIGDFGLAKLHKHYAAGANTTTQAQPSKLSMMFPTETLSTVQWCSPELLKGGAYSKSTDVYSFAIICWEILTLEQPFQDFNVMGVLEFVTSGKRPPLTLRQACNNQRLLSLIEQCWQQDLKKRPTFQEIITALGEL